MKDEVNLQESAGLVPSILGADTKFQPHAYYDKPGDAIRILTAEGNTTKVYVSQNLSLLEINYPENAGGNERKQDKYAGFVIEGARRFCKTNRLPHCGIIRIIDIIKLLIAIEKKEDGVAVALKLLSSNPNIREVEFS